MILGLVRRKRQASSSAIHPLDGFISSLMVLFLFHRSYQSCSHFLVVSMVTLNKILRGCCSQKRFSRVPDWGALVHHVVAMGFHCFHLHLSCSGSIAYTGAPTQSSNPFCTSNTVQSPAHNSFGFMFAGYEKVMNSGVCGVLRKCAFVLLSVFLRQYGASPQVVAASIVLYLATSVHLQYRPWRSKTQ